MNEKNKVFKFLLFSIVLALLAYFNVLSLSINILGNVELELLYGPLILCIPLIVLTMLEYLLDFIKREVSKGKD